MLIDTIFLMLLVFACYKGFSKGFIVAIFSMLGFIIGLAAALKLSTTVAAKFSDHNDMAKWMPALSFVLVFLAVAFLIALLGKLVQKTFEVVMLGWANRLAGAALYTILYSIILSIFLFYAVQLHLINSTTTSSSITYPYLKMIGPKVMDYFGLILPWFKNMFSTLQGFFETFAKQ